MYIYNIIRVKYNYIKAATFSLASTLSVATTLSLTATLTLTCGPLQVSMEIREELEFLLLLEELGEEGIQEPALKVETWTPTPLYVTQ